MKNDLPKDWDDNPEWTEADFARARPASEVLPPEIVAQLVRNWPTQAVTGWQNQSGFAQNVQAGRLRAA